MYQQRKETYKLLEAVRHSRLLVYVTGDRPGLETQIASEVYDFFVNQLDRIGTVEKLSFYLYTRGGDTLAAWSIINLLQQFSDEIEIIIPSKCHSAGTLMCLGANRIVMTKQATLGPIDPSINHPLNPQIPGAAPDAKVPVSVEAIEGFIQLAKEECLQGKGTQTDKIIEVLADKVHPIVLGQVFRTKAQIRMLASRLIRRQMKDEKKIGKIVQFLVSESGSHDYTINRKEARDELGLIIDKPDDHLYSLIKGIYDDIERELELSSRFDLNSFMGQASSRPYAFKRSLIESCYGGSYSYVSEGNMTKIQVQNQGLMQTEIQDRPVFRGMET